MRILLIPGLWLDGSSWDEVVPVLEQAGHRVHALTLPGMESRTADRSGITLRDHVDAVIAQIDAIDPAEGRVALVGHSGGGTIAYAAIDARPERVAHVVFVAGEPAAAGKPINDGFPVENGEIPLPDWSTFGDEELVGLDDALRARFRERAIPSPLRVTQDPQQLSDERRLDVPATYIACEFSSAKLLSWMAEGDEGLLELSRIRKVDYVDLDTGHWPQFTRPEDLGRAIVAAVERG